MFNFQDNTSVTRARDKVNIFDIVHDVGNSVDKMGKTPEFSTDKSGAVDAPVENSGSYPPGGG